VLSSRKGEFEAGFERSGQTREHALLAKTLGVKKLICVINKMDDATTNWSKDRYDAIKDDVTKYLKTIGFLPNDVTFLPLSGFNGSNIKVPVLESDCPWWKYVLALTFFPCFLFVISSCFLFFVFFFLNSLVRGMTLLDTLDSLQPLERMDELPLRIPLLDRYKESGKTVLMGKVETGVLKVGDELHCNPNNVCLISSFNLVYCYYLLFIIIYYLLFIIIYYFRCCFAHSVVENDSTSNSKR
jgi:peptide chain release factor subunit 3